MSEGSKYISSTVITSSGGRCFWTNFLLCSHSVRGSLILRHFLHWKHSFSISFWGLYHGITKQDVRMLNVFFISISVNLKVIPPLPPKTKRVSVMIEPHYLQTVISWDLSFGGILPHSITTVTKQRLSSKVSLSTLESKE